jgi:hypothetical protein
MNDSQDSQARLGIIGIKRNRTLVVSVLNHHTARSYQFVSGRNPTAGYCHRQQIVRVLTNVPAGPRDHRSVVGCGHPRFAPPVPAVDQLRRALLSALERRHNAFEC